MRLAHMSAALLLAASAFIAIPARAEDKPAPQARPAAPAFRLPAGVKVEADISYIENGDEAQKLDIYLPETPSEKPEPLLVWIHGGGWTAGSKKGCPFTGLVNKGYIVASVEYRFSQKALFPAQIQDCQAAIRFLRANAKKYNIDPAHIGVGGASAGGHLVALLGVAGDKKAFAAIGGNENQSDAVQAVLDLFGPTDFHNVEAQAGKELAESIFNFKEGKEPYSKLIGVRVGEDEKKDLAVSPVHYVSAQAAPFLILHGDHDALVPYAQSTELAELLSKAGVEVTLQKFPGSGHGGPAFQLAAVLKLENEFFDVHLKGASGKIQALPDSEVQPPPAKK